MTYIEKALELAVAVHVGQVDRLGRPYILHILRVSERAESDLEMVIALLKDVIEDSGGALYVEDLKGSYPVDVLKAVDALTRRDGEKYQDHIERCAKDPLATRVKLYELCDNMHPGRQDFIGSVSLFKRNEKAKDFLEDVIIANPEKYD